MSNFSDSSVSLFFFNWVANKAGQKDIGEKISQMLFEILDIYD